MIRKLILKNFQRHKKLVVRFGRITTIVGATDAGKSAIVRALRWSLLNRPAGTPFMRRGADHCRAAVSVDEHRVTRSRRKSRNSYKLDDEEYTAFGNNVPDPVAEVVNVCEDNFQKQHDAPYWLSLSPGELSRALNEVVDLEVVDRTLRNLNREVRSAKSTVEVTTERLAEAKAERERLSHVAVMEDELVALEEQHKRTVEVTYKAARLRGVLDDVMEEQEVVDRIRKVVGQMGPGLKGIEKMQKAYQEAADRRYALFELIDECRKWEERIADTDDELKKANAELAQYDSCPWCGSEMKCDH